MNSNPERRILIIKTGYSETFVDDCAGRVCSLGDVLRTTVILHLFHNDHVTWLTDRAALPLLEGNERIRRLLTIDRIHDDGIFSDYFDMIVNLEKDVGLCRRAWKMRRGALFGFAFDPERGIMDAPDNREEFINIINDSGEKRRNGRGWAEMLYSMLGAEWKGQNCLLGHRPSKEPQFDFGFNKFVGKKFPNKEWPQTHWDELGKMLSGRFSFSVQRHLDDLTGYIEWIDSCRALITCDSLGLHIGLALEKRVILLIGPSSSAEIPGNGNLRVLKPHPPGDCSPCCLPECGRDDPCMKYISPLAVFEVLKEWADRGAGGDRC